MEAEENFWGSNGRALPVITRRSRIIGPDGHRYLLGTVSDVSALREREARLIEANRRAAELQSHLESLLQSLPVGILILDQDRVIQYANRALFDLVGLDAGVDVLGWAYADFIDFNERRVGHELSAEETGQLSDARLGNLDPASEPRSWSWRTPHGTELAGCACRLRTGQYLLAYSDVSALRQRQSESELFRSAIDQLPVPVFIRDNEHRIVFVNRAYEELTGKSRDIVLGEQLPVMFPQDAATMAEQLDGVLEHGHQLSRDQEYRRDDLAFSVITRLGRTVTSNGERYVVGSITDVTALKRRQEALEEAQRETEKLYRDLYSAFSALPVGVLIVNRDMIIEFANDACAQIFAYPDTDLFVGKGLREFWEANRQRAGVPEGDFDHIWQARSLEFKTLQGAVERELTFPDGKYLIRKTIRLTDGKLLISYTDLTGLRAKEQEVDQARSQLSRLGRMMQESVQVMSQGLLVVEGAQIVQSNDMAARILSLPGDMLRPGEPWRGVYGMLAGRGDLGENPQGTLDEWRARLAEEKSIAVTFTAAGTTTVQLELTASGRNMWMVVLTDITERTQREQDRERLLHLAKAADRTKSDFIANMSHEFRTPMNGVLGMAELLSRSNLDTRQQTFVDIIVKSGNALMTIINDILDFSRIEAGELTLKHGHFDPVEAVEDVASLLSASAAEKGVELIVRTPVGGRRLMTGDAGRFRQIITNLVGNAIRFTDHGHVLVHLDSVADGEDQDMLTLVVEDTGLGIPADSLATLFDKFSTVGNTASGHDGTGLGLAITARLVSMFGGRIEVESQQGQGTRFTVTLSLAGAQSRRDVARLPVFVDGARVLVVDDNGLNGRAVAEQLTGFGFEAVAVESGISALALMDMAHLAGTPIDAVVIDEDMPRLRGHELVERLRQDPRNAATGVILLTAMAINSDDRSIEDADIQAQLMKPARATTLRARLIDVIRSMRREAGRALPQDSDMPVDAPAASEAEEETLPNHLVDILVADDNAVNRIVFSQILQSLGYSFEIVEDGELAVAAWQTLNPALILMDLAMPGMDGLEATRRIRSLEAEQGRGRTAIVAVTARVETADRDAATAAGMDDFLAKPVSPDMVQRKIDTWLHDARPVAQASAGRS